MSVTIDMSERQLKFGFLKLALSLAGLIALIGFALSLVANNAQSLALGTLLISVSFAMIVNGILGILKIIDWFEARRVRHDV